METEKLKSNINKIYLLNASFSFLILMPIIVPFFQSRGLNMENVYQLQAIFAFFVLIFEVPSGYFSDLFGRKKTLMTAGLFHSLGFLLMAMAQGFIGMVVAEVLLALAISLFSGTDLSLLYDSLNKIEGSGAPIKKVGRNMFFRQMGESVAGLVGGWLVLISLDVPAWSQALVGLVPLIIASQLYEPPREKLEVKKHKENFKYITKSLFGHSVLLNLILLNGIFYSFVTLVAVWSFQKYWSDIGIPLYYFGYLWFFVNATVGVTARYAHKVEKYLSSEWVLIIIGVFPVIGFLGMAFVDAIYGALFCLFFQVVRGLSSVIFADALNKRVASDMRATANSIMGLGTRILMIAIGPIVGMVIDQSGNAQAQAYLGYFYILIFIAVLLPLLNQRNNYERVGSR